MCALGLKWPRLVRFNIYVASLLGLAMPFVTGDFKQWSTTLPMMNILLIFLFAYDTKTNVIFMSIKIIAEAVILQYFDESLSSKSLATVLFANLISVTLTMLGFMCTISYIGQILERIDGQMKTIQTLFGEMHEGVVVVD